MRLVRFDTASGPSYVNPQMVIGLDPQPNGYTKIYMLCDYKITVIGELGRVAALLTAGIHAISGT